MSNQAITNLRRDVLTLVEIAVYEYLNEWEKDKGGSLKTSTRRLAKEVGISHQSVNNALSRLAKRGKITVLATPSSTIIQMYEGK